MDPTEAELIHTRHDLVTARAGAARQITEARGRLAVALEAIECERLETARRYVEAADDILKRHRQKMIDANASVPTPR